MMIDLENHFAAEPWLQALKTNPEFPVYREEVNAIEFFEGASMPLAMFGRPLLDLGEGRIGQMDEAGLDYAVLSLTIPGCEQFELDVARPLARDCNDVLAAAMQQYPMRFGGFASLVPQDTAWSCQELERCVKQLGFTGWYTHSNLGGSYLDEPRYWPILAKAEELDVPIYVHPTCPAIPELCSFGMMIAGPSFGYGVEVSYLFLRMCHRRVFDEFPKLKIILGHYGEGLPFIADRIDRAHIWKTKPRVGVEGLGSEEAPSYYLRNNVWVTTSGSYLPAAFECARSVLGIERILLGTDYPYERLTEAIGFLKSLRLSEQEQAMLFEANARGLGFLK